MAETITPGKLSGAADGNPPISVTGTTTGTADTIHTAVAGTTDWDETFIYANNNSDSSVTLTVEIGSATKVVVLPAYSGDYLVISGIRYNNGLVIKAFASTTAVVWIGGNINKVRFS